MTHDQLFKDVLRTFFQEMLELFAPNIAHGIDPQATNFRDTQLFTDLPAGTLRVADQVAQVQPLAGPPQLVLIHTEVQVKDG